MNAWTARAAVVLVALLPAASAGTPVDPAVRLYHEPLAVVLEVVGEVEWTSTGDRAPARPVTRLQALNEGARLRFPAGSRVRLFCSVGTFLELRGHVEVTLDLCRGGRPLPGDSAALLRPQAGRFRTLGQSLELVGDLRGERGDAPLLLYPRNSRVIDGRPVIGWTAVDGAAAYEVQVTGGSVRLNLRLVPDDLHCGVRQLAGLSMSLCELTWPQNRPELPAGALYQLNVRAARSSGPWLDLQEVNRFAVLSPAEAAVLRARLCQMDGLEVDPFTRLLLQAGTAAGSGLLASAAAAYEEAAAGGGDPEVDVTLGDVYRAAGLYELAAAAYRRAQGSGVDPASGSPTHAAAELGLARLSADRNDRPAARAAFERARREFERLGLFDEAREAERELARLVPDD